MGRVAKTKGVDLNNFFSGVPNSADDRSFLSAIMEGGVQIPKSEIVHINGFSSDLDREVSKNADIETSPKTRVKFL
jgi:hypothetical protein